MKCLPRAAIAAGLVCLTPFPALAADDEDRPIPQVFSDLIACQDITDDSQRLACYDGRVAAIRTAQEDDSIVVVDRQEVRDAERGLFGLRLPRLFGSGDDQIQEIESTITSVSGGTRSRPWVFSLEDGSTWAQIGSEVLSRSPQQGQPVKIRRAALGSFRAEIDGMRLIRVRRVE